MCRLFPCIPIFRRFFIKKCKKNVCVVGLKIVLLLVKNVFFGVKKGMSKLRGFFCFRFLSNSDFKVS